MRKWPIWGIVFRLDCLISCRSGRFFWKIRENLKCPHIEFVFWLLLVTEIWETEDAVFSQKILIWRRIFCDFLRKMFTAASALNFFDELISTIESAADLGFLAVHSSDDSLLLKNISVMKIFRNLCFFSFLRRQRRILRFLRFLRRILRVLGDPQPEFEIIALTSCARHILLP